MERGILVPIQSPYQFFSNFCVLDELNIVPGLKGPGERVK